MLETPNAKIPNKLNSHLLVILQGQTGKSYWNQHACIWNQAWLQDQAKVGLQNYNGTYKTPCTLARVFPTPIWAAVYSLQKWMLVSVLSSISEKGCGNLMSCVKWGRVVPLPLSSAQNQRWLFLDAFRVSRKRASTQSKFPSLRASFLSLSRVQNGFVTGRCVCRLLPVSRNRTVVE